MAFWNKKNPDSRTEKTQNTAPPVAPRPAHLKPTMPGLKEVKNIIAVASGKGGVGKSTVSTNLAFFLADQGYKVGLLDADIYGPSQSGLLGAREGVELRAEGNLVYPAYHQGISFVSMGLLAKEDSPVVWRAPMAMKMVTQFMNISWGELDYLLIDLPPGTGDVQITLSQQASLTGAIIVCTPQRLALEITQKGLKMFEQVNVPILGIVENMSGFDCPKCHHVTPIFKEGGGKEMAKHLKVPFLGSIPLDPVIMASGDDGESLIKKPHDSHARMSFEKLTARVLEEISLEHSKVSVNMPEHIDLDPEGKLLIKWTGGKESHHDPYTLRVNCSCASCIDENTGKRILDPKRVPLDIKIQSAKPVGRYGLSLNFSDGHGTGIYKFDRLLNMQELAKSEKPNGDQPENEETFSV